MKNTKELYVVNFDFKNRQEVWQAIAACSTRKELDDLLGFLADFEEKWGKWEVKNTDDGVRVENRFRTRDSSKVWATHVEDLVLTDSGKICYYAQPSGKVVDDDYFIRRRWNYFDPIESSGKPIWMGADYSAAMEPGVAYWTRGSGLNELCSDSITALLSSIQLETQNKLMPYAYSDEYSDEYSDDDNDNEASLRAALIKDAKARLSEWEKRVSTRTGQPGRQVWTDTDANFIINMADKFVDSWCRGNRSEENDIICRVLDTLYNEEFKTGSFSQNGKLVYYICPADTPDEVIDYLKAVWLGAGIEFKVSNHKCTKDEFLRKHIRVTDYFAVKWDANDIKQRVAKIFNCSPEDVCVLDLNGEELET